MVALSACEAGLGAPEAEPEPEPEFETGFASPDTCGGCHPTHYAQWRISNHAYAMKDPVLQAMVALGQRDTDGELGDFCVSCHSPIAVATGQTDVVVDPDSGEHVQDLGAIDALGMHGVSCDTCHTISAVHGIANADFELTPDGTRRATITSPVDNDFHRSTASTDFDDSALCGTCHNVISEFFTEPVRLESTFREWQISGFNGMQDCQDCHMPASLGRAAVGGPEREIHDHRMVGVDVSLLPRDDFPGYDAMREATTELLQASAELSSQWDGAARTLRIRIDNLAGHALPSGATADREMWVHLQVRDAGGELVFESGALDERGDLKQENPAFTLEPGADPQLTVFRQQMLFDPRLEDPDDDGPVREVDFLWEPNTFEERLVPAGGLAYARYELSMLAPGSYDVRVRLLFRTFPPHLLRKLVDAGLLDPDVPGRVPTVEMETLTLSIDVHAANAGSQ